MPSSFRSANWLHGDGETQTRHRAALATLGFDPAQIDQRPIIGICYPRSEFNNCEVAFDALVPAIQRGVSEAGGVPLLFGAMSLGGELQKPADMLYRNLVAMEVEETIRSYPIDGVVLLCNCDKTTPAQLMAAASADIPAVQFNAGHKAISHFRGETISSGTDFWRLLDQRRSGQLTDEQWAQLQQCLSCSTGACNEMGTTSTMTALSEALGMLPPLASTLPAHDTRRTVAAANVGRRIVAMVHEDLRPSAILTPQAFENAIRVLHALGGSTNAIIHLIAIAGRRGIRLPLSLFDELAATTPLLANVKPSGQYMMAHFHEAGGVPALMAHMRQLLHLDCRTMTGRSIAENLTAVDAANTDVIRTLNEPVRTGGSLAVLKGNLAPRGAVVKTTAATTALLEHRGPAVVFEDYADMLSRIDSDALPVTPHSVLVMRNAGPVGVPGMPEWGEIPIPRKMLRQGVRDMVRISDARMSGTSFGTVVLHVVPEAAVGGPLARIRDGDIVRLSVRDRRLDVEVDPQQFNQRSVRQPPTTNTHRRGYPRLYAQHVLQADQGCDFDFLVPSDEKSLAFVEPVVGRT